MIKIKFITLIIVIIFLDLLTKNLTFSYVENFIIDNELQFPSVKITNFFNLVIVWNNGVSFGMFSNFANAKYFIFLINILIIIYLFVWFFRNQKIYIDYALSFIIAGALGNLIDRAINGAVADFLDFHLFGYHWPAFNVADSAITVGVIFIIFDELFLSRKREKETPPE